MNARLKNMALKDPLTGMSNRAALDMHINQVLRRSRRRHTPLAVMLIDLDGFKHLNDQLGDDTGDRIICAVAKRLIEVARETDFVARLGGDVFVLIVDDVSDSQQTQLIAERLLDTLTPPSWIWQPCCAKPTWPATHANAVVATESAFIRRGVPAVKNCNRLCGYPTAKLQLAGTTRRILPCGASVSR